MLGVFGYKTKAGLKRSIGEPLNYVETSVFGPEYHGDGCYAVVGPDAYRDRRWYATVRIAGGLITKVT